MTMRTTLFSAVTTIAVFAAYPATAQEAGSKQTRDYVQAAGQSDAFEMLEADTVLAQSRDPQVRAFAQQMLRDHAQLSQTLAKATAQSGLKPPPMSVGADQAPLLGALQNMRGLDFDRAYWRHQALAHRSALTTTQLYATNGDDPIVKQAAAAASPIIAGHLAMAEEMQAKAGS
jgi:putative membrane protein